MKPAQHISFLLISLLFVTPLSFSAPAKNNCDLIYDEYESLMNKDFLIKPQNFVSVKKKRLSRSEYNSKQKGIFTLKRKRKNLGIAIVKTNDNKYGKLLFTWGRNEEGNALSLIIKESIFFGRVNNGHRPKILRDMHIASSNTLDLDTGRAGGDKADIWFHNVDNNTMYIEAINGASLTFPLESLCKQTSQTHQLQALPLQALNPAPSAQLTSIGTGPTTPPPTRYIIRREILANGHIVIYYSDKSKVERYNGGYTMTHPDGSEAVVLMSTGAPSDIPVDPPSTNETQWLNNHRQHLLNTIQTLVDDPQLAQDAINAVDTSNNLYQSITTRTQIIDRLVSP